MSRARRTSTGLIPAVIGLGTAVVLGLGGCSAGQITETNTQLPAVNGGMGQAGAISLRNIQLAYPPDGSYSQGARATVTGTIINDGLDQDELVSVSSPVATKVTINGSRLLPARRVLVVEKGFEIATSTPSSSVTPSETSAQAPPEGVAPSSAPETPGSDTSASEVTPTSEAPSSSVEPTSSEAPTSASETTQSSVPLDRGEVVITLDDLKEPVRSGKTVPITFVFRNGGSVIIQVPVAVPTKPRGAAEDH